MISGIGDDLCAIETAVNLNRGGGLWPPLQLAATTNQALPSVRVAVLSESSQCASRRDAGGPRPLEVVAAELTGDVNHFADKK
jgi:hypothetical protein